MKTLLTTITSLVLTATLGSVASAQTLDPSTMNQDWQDGQPAEMYQAPDQTAEMYQDQGQYADQAQMFGFFGPHPIAYDRGGGFCNHQGSHEHNYPVFDQNLFRMSNGYAYFVGDVADFGYGLASYQYGSEHPLSHIHGGGYCFMGWPHRHWFAPVGVNFVMSTGGYMYNGPWASDYYTMRPRYVSYYNDYYRRWYLGGRYYSLRPQHVYFGTGYHRPVVRTYGGYGYGRPYGTPVYRAPSPVYRAPVYGSPVRPAPVYRAPVYGSPVRPAPVYHAPAPVYRAPAPVYHSPAPVYRAPAAPVYRAPMHNGPAPMHHSPAPVHHARGWR